MCKLCERGREGKGNQRKVRKRKRKGRESGEDYELSIEEDRKDGLEELDLMLDLLAIVAAVLGRHA